MIKVRMDGPPGRRWIEYARWWWELNRGEVPPGKRICHADGNLLNDAQENLVALTPGEVFNLYHKLNPEMSRRNHQACGRSATARNIQTGRVRRETTWLACQWYGVDLDQRVIHNQPRRKRWMVYRDHGFFQMLADTLKMRTAAAIAGDVAASAFVFDQASKLGRYWRWLRSAGLGWPGINCMSACILHVLAAGGGSMTTTDLIAEVEQFRRMLDWQPYKLHRGVAASCISGMRQWICTERQGRACALLTIQPEAIAARTAGPRIVPVRGLTLREARFADFIRINPSHIESASSQRRGAA